LSRIGWGLGRAAGLGRPAQTAYLVSHRRNLRRLFEWLSPEYPSTVQVARAPLNACMPCFLAAGSFEVNFAYLEEGEQKNALVKLRCCPECAYMLNYKSIKRKERKDAKLERKRRKVA
jgi:hypothetical protein